MTTLPPHARRLPARQGMFWLLGLALFGISAAASAQDSFFSDWEISGYMRAHLSMNLNNPYVPDPANDGEPLGNFRNDLSMVRGSVRLNLFKDFGNSQFNVVVRGAGEYETHYLKQLQRVMDSYAATDLFSNRTGSSVDLMNDVYNKAEVREFWWQTEIRPGTTMKLGKQQVVWGETDFFQSLDVIHGYDMRWRSFLEPENEEVRKPLWMANLVQRFNRANGELQMLFIPGRMNPAEDRGNNYGYPDFSVGRPH